jgi:hypothetical protein
VYFVFFVVKVFFFFLQEVRMPMNESIAARIRSEVNRYPGVVEKKMFGGLCFIINGNMACGVNGSDLIVRVGPQKSEQALTRPFTGLFSMMTNRTMAGWVKVAPDGFATEQDLRDWVEQGMDFAMTLPPK